MSKSWLDDGDIRLYVGDVREVLANLGDESVDCVITSPPYWGLRSYIADGHDDKHHELGLEPTPDLYVANMVAVFREIRRVLAPFGTCWLNLGDTYAANRPYQVPDQKAKSAGSSLAGTREAAGAFAGTSEPAARVPEGLKPKDLVGIPWRVAFALQADGWWLRSDIIWSKPNPMPESVTDRPTKAHEYVFLLTKQPRYWFDAEAVRELHQGSTVERYRYGGSFNGGAKHEDDGSHWGDQFAADRKPAELNPAGRNVRSVWNIATQPYAEAHFATFPEELVRRCLLAGCPEWVCRVCHQPRERIVERTPAAVLAPGSGYGHGAGRNGGGRSGLVGAEASTVGWSDCSHNDYRPGVVLDPFLGSGTTALVARKHGRHAVGIELSEDYAALAGKRLQQLSLLA